MFGQLVGCPVGIALHEVEQPPIEKIIHSDRSAKIWL